MNKIVIGTNIFQDKDIIDGNIYVSNSPISEALEADTFEFTLYSQGQSDFLDSALKNFLTSDSEQLVVVGANLLSLKYGTPVEYYKDNALIGKFYIKSIKRTQTNQYAFECISMVGILSYIDHYGGIYGVDSPTYVTDLIEEIVGEDVIEIDSAFDAMRIQGYLPKASARDNLQQVLFAVGGAILKDTDGDLIIKYNQPETAKVLPNDSVYLGESYNYLTHATKVTLIEHSYFKGVTTETKEVFNNLTDLTTALGQEIIFSEPYYNYKAYDSSGTDITATFIIDSGVNFVKVGVSGTDKGRITATPYIHSQRQLTKSTGVETIEAKEVSVTDATLVSPYNSTNCLERLASYYGGANEVAVDFVYTDEHTGGLVQFKKPFDSGQQVGYLKNMSINLSNTLKATSTVAVDWTPNHLGNTYNAFKIIDKTELGSLEADWTVPEELQNKEAYIVLFNGADGGQGGYNGSNGGNASGVNSRMYKYNSLSEDNDWYIQYEPVNAGAGGAGGNGGSGGSGCSRYNAVITTLTSSTYHVKLGAGGTGGTANGGTGGTGGETTFASYSSDVHDLDGTYVNMINKAIYCSDGTDGENGGKGGDGGTATQSNITSVVVNSGTAGASVGTHTGGAGTAGNSTEYTSYYPQTWYSNVGGGGGGGASNDANGTDAGASDSGNTFDYWVRSSGSIFILMYKKGGDGGNGANAIAPTQTTYGIGGTGGSGGGGGGGAGASCSWSLNPEIRGGEVRPWASGGTGGSGSVGGQGSDGFIVIYYTED